MDTKSVIEAARARIQVRLGKITQEVRDIVRNAEARGIAPNFNPIRQWLAGIGEINDEGTITYKSNFKSWMAIA